MERLQKVIANSGFCSRRKAEELILKKRVKVNGNLVTKLGTKINTKDIVTIDDEIINKEDKVYYLLYKPRGYVTTTSDDKKRKVVTELIDTDKRIYPVGRLDYDTTGVLILTNDGTLANSLMHPKGEIDKVYIAKVEGIIKKETLKKLANGVYIDGIKTAPAKVRLKNQNRKTNTSLVEITIHEGRNHQIKKMFETVGYKVLKLKREKVAFLDLKGLKASEYRKLNPKEVKQLYNYCNNK